MADAAPVGEATGFFGAVSKPESTVVRSTLYEEGERWLKLFRVTPWLRFAGAAIGTLAATLALIWWAGRLLAG